jgi:hypothetical protein
MRGGRRIRENRRDHNHNWDLSTCNNLSASDTFEVCWKQTGTFNFPCGANRLAGWGESGSTTISGLSPSTAYKIRTKWHSHSAWHLVTNRTVTTDPSPTSADIMLRYTKAYAQGYHVDFYWKNSPSPPSALSLHLEHKSIGSFGVWASADNVDLTNATFNSATGEYHINLAGYTYNGGQVEFKNTRRYKAYIVITGQTSHASNTVEWH